MNTQVCELLVDHSAELAQLRDIRGKYVRTAYSVVEPWNLPQDLADYLLNKFVGIDKGELAQLRAARLVQPE